MNTGWDNKVDEVMDNVEKIRRQNNKNWCSILRIALKQSPKETKRLISNIYVLDNKISQELKKLI